MQTQSRQLRVVGALIVGALLLFGILLYRQSPTLAPCDSPYANVFDIVIDAGSTGSRVHVFQYERTSDGVILMRERFRRVEPGLSSYANDVDGAKASLRALLGVAEEVVPASYQRCTAVALRATAGLRLLPEGAQQALLAAASEVLAASPFVSRGASIITGAQEGVYGWLTVNYLLRRLDASGATVATIDMGGASTQVVFEAARQSGEWLPFNYAHQLRMPRRTITMYQHSYLGLGMNEAKKALTVAFAAANGTAPFACLPTGQTHSVGSIELHNPAAADFDACADLFRAHVITKTKCRFDRCGARGVPQPQLPTTQHSVYAFSYFYDRLYNFRAQGSPALVSSYREVGREVCGGTAAGAYGTAPVPATACMELAYLYTFLSYGLGLADDLAIKVPNRIEGMAVSWSLGASLSYVLKME